MGAFGNFLSLRAGRDAASTLFAALALVVGLTSSVMFYDGDTNWHVATGLWILDHRVVPTSDIFSFTAAGRKWVTHEWLSELLMGTAFKVFGWSGVRVLTAVAFAVASGVLARELLRHVGLVAGLMVVAVIFPVLVPHVIARPHTLALPILAIFVAELLRARRAGQRPSLWLLLLMVLWANIHGSYILGPVFAGFFALETLIETAQDRMRATLPWIGFSVAATACCLVTPSFIDGFLFPFTLVKMKSIASISEWGPAVFSDMSPLEICILATFFLVAYKRIEIGVARLALVLILLHMTLQHVRQEMVLVLVGAMVLAEPIGNALARTRQDTTAAVGAPRVAAASPDDRAARRISAAALLAIFLVCVARLAVPEPREETAVTPIAALAKVPIRIRNQPVFNEYSIGGWLIFNHIRSFIDGRNDMYGDELFQQYLDCAHGNTARMSEVFARYRIAWVIMPPTSPVIDWVARQPGWRALYRDKLSAVYIRDQPAT